MIYQKESKFYDLEATALVELSNGNQAEVITALNSEGLYSDYWECPTGCPEHGKIHYQECEIFEGSVKATYPEEFVYVENEQEGEIGIRIIKIIAVTKVDWKVDEE